MKKRTLSAALSLLSGILLAGSTMAEYGSGYCNDPGFYCITAQKGDTWRGFFPDDVKRDFVRRLNRTNSYMRQGQRIAVPVDFETVTLMDFAPFPSKIASSGANRIVIDQAELAWGGYDREGNLIKWGPISGGKDYCKDVKRACNTRPGHFVVYYKKGSRCVSKKFPIGKGGAKMPYCMFYDGGYAIHGSYKVPGYHDSHGCVRTFVDDARWLNREFVRIGETRVIIDHDLPLGNDDEESSTSSRESAIPWH